MDINNQLDNWLKTKKTIEEWVNLPPQAHFPWLTKRAILFIEQYLINKKKVRVLEFGGGSSTVYFARKECLVDTIEHNKDWSTSIKGYLTTYNLNKNVNVKFIPKPYHSVCEVYEKEFFDIVLIDGYDGRFLCMKNSFNLLKPDGIMVFDDVQGEVNKNQVSRFVKEKKLYAFPTKLKRRYHFNRLKTTVIYSKKPLNKK